MDRDRFSARFVNRFRQINRIFIASTKNPMVNKLDSLFFLLRVISKTEMSKACERGMFSINGAKLTGNPIIGSKHDGNGSVFCRFQTPGPNLAQIKSPVKREVQFLH